MYYYHGLHALDYKCLAAPRENESPYMGFSVVQFFWKTPTTMSSLTIAIEVVAFTEEQETTTVRGNALTLSAHQKKERILQDDTHRGL